MVRQLFIIFLMVLLNYFELKKSSSLNPKCFWIHQNLFKTGISFTIFFLIFIPLLLLMERRLTRFSQNSFEKGQVAACLCKRNMICANPRNLSTNRKKGISHACFEKLLVNSKAFGTERLTSYKFCRILKGELKKFMNSWRTNSKLWPIQSYHIGSFWCRISIPLKGTRDGLANTQKIGETLCAHCPACLQMFASAAWWRKILEK